MLLLVLLVLLPVVTGVLLPFLKLEDRKKKLTLLTAVMAVEAVGVTAACLMSAPGGVLFRMTESLVLTFRVDNISRLFALIAAWGWLIIGIFSYEYMKHEERENQFYACFMIVEGALLGKEPGDKVSFTLSPKDGYGEIIDEAIVELPKNIFMLDGKIAEDILFVGNTIPMSDAEGHRMNGTVREVKESAVVMDFNHPMAGKTLNFDVEVVSVRDVTPEDLASKGGCGCGCGEHDCSGCGDSCGEEHDHDCNCGHCH